MNPSLHNLLNIRVAVVFLSMAATAWCQDALPKPLPARMPDRAAWEITYVYSDETGTGATSRFAVYFPKTIEVEKSGNTVHETITYRSGKTQERWLQGAREAMRVPGDGTVVAVEYGEETPPDHLTYKDSDFQDLGWLGTETLRGTGTYEGRKVLVFVTRHRHLKSDEPFEAGKVPSLPVTFGKTRNRIAALDAKTFRPVYFFDGSSERRYEYPDAPSTPLAPPPEFAKVLDRIRSTE